jgi:hypothetical protein
MFFQMSCKKWQHPLWKNLCQVRKKGVARASAKVIISAACSSAEFFHQTCKGVKPPLKLEASSGLSLSIALTAYSIPQAIRYDAVKPIMILRTISFPDEGGVRE